MNPLRIVGLVSAIVAPFAIGFIVWHWLLGLLFGGATVIGFATASFLYAHAIFKKKRSEHAGPFAAFSTILVVAFAGWFVRAGFRQEAMVAESLRLVEEVEAILRRDGHLPSNLEMLQPRTPADRRIAWLAGSSVGYEERDGSFRVYRGDGIGIEVYLADSRTWVFTK